MNSVSIFGGSDLGRDPEFALAAKGLGVTLAQHGIVIFCGAGDEGLMRVVTDAALNAGGAVTGVWPRELVGKERPNGGLTELMVVETTADRKHTLQTLGDAFITLPGGIGTLDELFTVSALAKLGQHQKPIGVFNISHYFDPLILMIENMIAAGFLKQKYKELLRFESDSFELLNRLGFKI